MSETFQGRETIYLRKEHMEIYGTFIGSFLWANDIGEKMKWAVRKVLSDSDYFGSCCKEMHAIFTKTNNQSLVQRLF